MENEAKTDIAQKIGDYNEVIVRFAELLRAENEALRAFDVARVSALFEQKSKLSLAYRSMVFYQTSGGFKVCQRGAKRDLASAFDGAGKPV